jgi:hypothetical protein
MIMLLLLLLLLLPRIHAIHRLEGTWRRSLMMRGHHARVRGLEAAATATAAMVIVKAAVAAAVI